jgi:prephenate dehydratase
LSELNSIHAVPFCVEKEPTSNLKNEILYLAHNIEFKIAKSKPSREECMETKINNIMATLSKNKPISLYKLVSMFVKHNINSLLICTLLINGVIKVQRCEYSPMMQIESKDFDEATSKAFGNSILVFTK